jgi:hypothetical protein
MSTFKPDFGKAMERLQVAREARRASGEPGVVPESPEAMREAAAEIDVLVPLYGYGRKRAAATGRALANLDRVFGEFMPRITVAFCYGEGEEPKELACLHKYPWVRLIRLPEYAADDGIFKKEGLLNLLLREWSTRPVILCLDSDVWTEDRMWFARIAATAHAHPSSAFQPWHTWHDTESGPGQPSWSARILRSAANPNACIHPGMAWAFAREWAERHERMAVWNPWLATGSGDCMFILEHWPEREARCFADRHATYAYFRDVSRKGLPKSAADACVDTHIVHESHTDLGAVPTAHRSEWLADRAYRWSREWLDMVGPLTDWLHLDAAGVPVANEPEGPFVRTARRKPEMQDEGATLAILRETFGSFVRCASRQEYDYLAKHDEYYRQFDRWTHFYVPILDAIRRLPLARTRLGVLEVGPRRFPLIHYAESMDVKDWGVPRTVVHDAGEIPWPFADATKSVVVLSHVLEHLPERARNAAVREACRVAETVIVAMPYRWDRGDGVHSGLTETDMALWFCGCPGELEHDEITGPKHWQQLLWVWRIER